MRYWSAERRNVKFTGRGSSFSASSFSHFISERRPHPSPLPNPLQASRTNTNTEISPRKMNSNTHLYTVASGSSLFVTRSPKGGRRKGAKGHLKARVNGEAFEYKHCVLQKEVRLKNCETDKCVKWGLYYWELHQYTSCRVEIDVIWWPWTQPLTHAQV